MRGSEIDSVPPATGRVRGRNLDDQEEEVVRMWVPGGGGGREG